MYALEIQALRKVYAGGVEALKGVSLNVEQGDFMRYLGQMEQANRRLLG